MIKYVMYNTIDYISHLQCHQCCCLKIVYKQPIIHKISCPTTTKKKHMLKRVLIYNIYIYIEKQIKSWLNCLKPHSFVIFRKYSIGKNTGFYPSVGTYIHSFFHSNFKSHIALIIVHYEPTMTTLKKIKKR